MEIIEKNRAGIPWITGPVLRGSDGEFPGEEELLLELSL
jgi:hypothetical protein